MSTCCLGLLSLRSFGGQLALATLLNLTADIMQHTSAFDSRHHVTQQQ